MKLAHLVSFLALCTAGLTACDSDERTPPETELGEPATSLDDQAAADPATAPGVAVGDRGAGSEVDNAITLGDGDHAAGFITDDLVAPPGSVADDEAVSPEPTPAGDD